MNKSEIINKTIEFVKEEVAKNDAGHDWWHIYRVWNLAKTIGSEEDVDIFVVELGALLHDVADSKFYDGDETIGPRKVSNFLETLNLDEKIINHIVKIIKNMSFSKSLDGEREFDSLELQVVQDADLLDALGAIGVARTFTFGQYIGNPIYDPNFKPNINISKEEYYKRKGTTINHFYEKLLLLKDKMNTKAGRELAEHRHKYMEDFLDEFFSEWEGEK